MRGGLKLKPAHNLVTPLVVAATFAVIGVVLLIFSFAAVIKGDLNNDNKVDLTDLSYVLSKYGSNDSTADLNQDSKVDLGDISVILTNFGRSGSAPTDPPGTSGIQAVRAADFTDTVGVNIHVNYFDTSYGNWEAVKQKLQELKIKHVRGASYWNFAEADRRQDELRAMGIKVNMIMDADNYPQQMSYLKTKPSGFVTGVESLNEPDCFLAKRNPDWVNETRRLQQANYEAMKADPALRDIPVLSTSYCKSDTAAKVGDLSQWYDYTNTHPYPGGLAPEDRTVESVNNIRGTYGNKPMSATETGYHTAVPFLEGGGVSEQAAAIYIPRLYMTYFQAGFERTYLYELVEPRPGTWVTQTFDRDNHFGLYRSNFANKPAADSVRRMMAILNDSSANTTFSPGKLDYTLGGDAAGLQQMLLQKADGTFYLALWRKDSVWNVYNKVAINASYKPVTVTLNNGPRQVSIYNLNQSDTPISSAAEANFSLNLGPEIQILEIKP